MRTFGFQALGTTWSVSIDTDDTSTDIESLVHSSAERFEERFSRFLPESEVNAFRSAEAGTYPVSAEFAVLLERAQLLRELTRGVYDPVAGIHLERSGYGLQSTRGTLSSEGLPQWSLTGTMLTLSGSAVFDLGGIGKGYLIDQLSNVVRGAGYEYFLVEGGGDMFGTTKKNGDPWRIAIEYPGKSDTAAGLVELRHAGIAVSDIFRRRFGGHHHLVDATTGKEIEHVIGCAAFALNAWSADSLTSGLFLAPKEAYPVLTDLLRGEYLVFWADGTVEVSPHWPGELFT